MRCIGAIGTIAGLVSLAGSALAATVTVDMVPCILAAGTIVSAAIP